MTIDHLIFAFKVNYASTFQEGVYFFRCMLKILYSIPERFLHRHAWQIESISQTGRMFFHVYDLRHGSGQGDHTETGDSVDSSDAPVIRSGLNQLELLTGVRMMIRILSYEDHLIDSSDSPVIRYVPDHLELLSEHCHIVILKIILFAKNDPRQTLTKFTTIASSLLLFVLATLKKDIFDKCDVNQTARTS